MILSWGSIFLMHATCAGFLTLEEIDESEFGLELPNVKVETHRKKSKGKTELKRSKVNEAGADESSDGEVFGECNDKYEESKVDDEKKKVKQKKKKKKNKEEKKKKKDNQNNDETIKALENAEAATGSYANSLRWLHIYIMWVESWDFLGLMNRT